MIDSVKAALLDKIEASVAEATRRDLDERMMHPARLGDGTPICGNTVEGYTRLVVATLTGRALVAADGTVAAAPLVGASLRRAVEAIWDNDWCQSPLYRVLRDWAFEARRELDASPLRRNDEPRI